MIPLGEAVHLFINNDLPRLQRGLDFYRNSTFDVALENAILSQMPNKHGEMVMDAHQSHIGYAKMDEIRITIEQNIERISESETWQELFSIIDRVRSQHFVDGHLWAYDFALRIGVKLGMAPDNVYLQRGALWGAEQLLGRRIRDRFLPLSDFPISIQGLGEEYIIENFLCVGHKKGWFN